MEQVFVIFKSGSFCAIPPFRWQNVPCGLYFDYKTVRENGNMEWVCHAKLHLPTLEIYTIYDEEKVKPTIDKIYTMLLEMHFFDQPSSKGEMTILIK